MRSPDGRGVGHVRVLVIDLAGGLDRLPVTGVVIGGLGQADRVVAWDRMRALGNHGALVSPESTDVAQGRAAATSTAVLVRRDVLDSPVVTADPRAEHGSGAVVLDLDEGRAWVTGLEISTAGTLRLGAHAWSLGGGLLCKR